MSARRPTARRPGAPAAVALALAAVAGCAHNEQFLTAGRLNRGLVVILPGVEGASRLNRSIRRGLDNAGVAYAMPIHSWGRPVPFLGVLINQMDFLGNRLSAIGVARMIMNYQDSHPGRPVFIVGHSGGGGIAVFAAEGLPEDRKIDGLVLLSASISSAYNVTKALTRCRRGIVSFYNPADAGALGLGTTLLGNVDGIHGPSAGLIGFDEAGPRDRDETKLAYARLYQLRLTGDAAVDNPHAAATDEGFVAANVAPWLLSDRWPAMPGATLGYEGPLPATTMPVAESRPAPKTRPAETRPSETRPARKPPAVKPPKPPRRKPRPPRPPASQPAARPWNPVVVTVGQKPLSPMADTLYAVGRRRGADVAQR